MGNHTEFDRGGLAAFLPHLLSFDAHAAVLDLDATISSLTGATLTGSVLDAAMMGARYNKDNDDSKHKDYKFRKSTKLPSISETDESSASAAIRLDVIQECDADELKTVVLYLARNLSVLLKVPKRKNFVTMSIIIKTPPSLRLLLK